MLKLIDKLNQIGVPFRFKMDLDIAAPKVTIPTDFYPDGVKQSKLLLDFGHFNLKSDLVRGAAFALLVLELLFFILKRLDFIDPFFMDQLVMEGI